MGTNGVTILVDDVRSFRDGRACVIARTAEAGLEVLQEHRHVRIDVVFLDHDLGRRRNAPDLTVMPVVDEFVAAALGGDPYNVGVIFIHSANVRAAVAMKQKLTSAGFNTRGHHAFVWRHDEAHLSGRVGEPPMSDPQ